MQLARTTAVFVVIVLLTLVGTAAAECAWVPCQYTTMQPSPSSSGETWGPVSDFAGSGARECEETLQVLMKQEQPKKDTATARFRSTYVCVLDTIDPRGPKGSEAGSVMGSNASICAGRLTA